MELASSVGALILMAAAAAIIGYSKTAVGGLGVVAVAIFATVLPARESTAAILMILIVGDVIACWHYRRDPDWGLIRRLLPAVIPGLRARKQGMPRWNGRDLPTHDAASRRVGPSAR